jgi:hypothetical protein
MLQVSVIVGIALNVLGTMFRICLISAIGVWLTRYPKESPTLTKPVLTKLSYM